MGATLSYITRCPRWLCRCDLARCPFAQLGNLRRNLSDVRQPLIALSDPHSALSVFIFVHLISIFYKILAFLSLFRLDPCALCFHFVTLSRLFYSLISNYYGKR